MLTWRRALWLGTLLAVLVVGIAGFLIYRNNQICLLYTSPSPRD